MKHFAVVGGGISGLAAAWELIGGAGNTPKDLRVTLVAESLGGKLSSVELAGAEVDAGPDGFIARGLPAIELCQELGLPTVAPTASSAYVWTRGKMRRLPAGLVLGFPGEIAPLLRSGIVSPPGILRAALDLLLPRNVWPADFSVADAVDRRFGKEVTERLVEPLLGGIHAAGAASISLPEVAPHVAEALRSHRSALWAVRSLQLPASSGPVFLAPEGGMHRLAREISRGLAERGVELREGARVTEILFPPGRNAELRLDRGESLVANALVLATPAYEAARLVGGIDSELGTELGGIEHSSVAVTTLAYPRGAIPSDLGGTGFLSPRCEGRLMTAATWLSNKWEHYGRLDASLARVSMGRSGDDRTRNLGDSDLAEAAHRELSAAMSAFGVSIPAPVDVAVTRWEDALPLFGVGHRARVTRIEELVRARPSIKLAGAYLHGVGVPACIASARQASRELVG